ncbi:MAG: ribosomal protein L17 [uncultured bacterium]|uniref:Large ribosomal subunit protein bL17 n=1 Tax=candidate division WWE3 bacterium RBG_16_37_10 TaxID=1802610 RepID=A0A1F4V2W6_UNCKA|nr:MAG: ribosomal protein L17 [uncultured bacterium]OGC51544.1 MAG: 50S ribosomal protein L17 [candidate division WWE3 bacterium RBG_16_37_10]
MLHRVKEKKLGRDAAHRKALIKNLSTSIIEYKQVVTTLAKAKYARPFVEKLVTKAKQNKNLKGQKFAEARLTTEKAVRALFDEIVPQFETRVGGYTRIVKLPQRGGDTAKMARFEFVIDKPKKTVAKKAKEEVKETNKTEEKEVKE